MNEQDEQNKNINDKADNRYEIEIQTAINTLIGLILIIIIGNYIFDAKMIFHSYGHYGIILHPWKCLKEFYFSWGFDGDKFLFTFQGLKTFFIYIQAMYTKYGFLNATWCLLTQFSPLWGIPIILLAKIVYNFEINGQKNVKKILLAIFIICLIIGLIDNSKYSNLTPRQKQYLQTEKLFQKGNRNARNRAIKFVDSYKIVNDMSKNISKEIETLADRQDLGIEDNTSQINLLKYKNENLEYLLNADNIPSYYNGYYNGNGCAGIKLTLDAPCSDYCCSCAMTNEEDKQQCIVKYTLYNIEQLIAKYSNAEAAYQTEKITREEFNNIKNEIQTENKKIIAEAKKINNLKQIPLIKSCQNICETKDSLASLKKEWQSSLSNNKKNYEEKIQNAKNYVERFPADDKTWDKPRSAAIDTLENLKREYKESTDEINNSYSQRIKELEEQIKNNKKIYALVEKKENIDDTVSETLFIKNKVYKKLGIPEGCLKDWQILQAEGEFTEEPNCNADEIEKVDKYCKEHEECYVFYD